MSRLILISVLLFLPGCHIPVKEHQPTKYDNQKPVYQSNVSDNQQSLAEPIQPTVSTKQTESAKENTHPSDKRYIVVPQDTVDPLQGKKDRVIRTKPVEIQPLEQAF